jgi:hypothetical protein
MLPAPSRPLLALLVAPLVSACGTTVTSQTTLGIGDPSRVEILRGDRVVLPEGHAPAEVPLGPEDVEPAPGARSHVGIAALRASTGAISFKWDTRLPLVTGEEQKLVSTAASPVRLVDAVDLDRPAFRQALCVSLRHEGTGGYRAGLAMHACGSGDLGGVTLAIETPWSNVVVTRRTEIVPHAREQVFWTGGALVLVPVLVLSTGATFDSAELPVLASMGGMLVVGGLVMAASTLLPEACTRVEVLRPHVAGRPSGC